MYFTKYSPVLGALLDTELRNALIQNDGSFLLWQSPVALTRHRTYNFLTLDCQKFYSPFLKQSSLSLRVGLCCCWSYIYWHSVATVEDYGWLVHSNLKDKQLNDHYFIFIHVSEKVIAYGLRKEKKQKELCGSRIEYFGKQREQQFSGLKIFFKNLLQNDGVTINKGILSEVNYKRILIKGVSFKRNCGAASLGEYNRVIKYHQLSW